MERKGVGREFGVEGGVGERKQCKEERAEGRAREHSVLSVTVIMMDGTQLQEQADLNQRRCSWNKANG